MFCSQRTMDDAGSHSRSLNSVSVTASVSKRLRAFLGQGDERSISSFSFLEFPMIAKLVLKRVVFIFFYCAFGYFREEWKRRHHSIGTVITTSVPAPVRTVHGLRRVYHGLQIRLAGLCRAGPRETVPFSPPAISRAQTKALTSR
jgi:hypothetical protein